MAEGSSAFSVRPLNPAPGQSGIELPKAGAVGSLLVKNGQDIKDVAWTTKGALASAIGIPAGGATGSVLSKNSATDYDDSWVTRAALAGDTAFTSVFVSGTQGAGAPGGTGNNGDRYYDTTNDRAYMSDGAGWIVMAEPDQSYTVSITNISSATATGRFHRSDGYVDFFAEVTLTGAGAVTGQPTISLPMALAAAPRGALQVNLKDATGVQYTSFAEALTAGATTVAIYFMDTSGAAGFLSNVLAASPVTWAAPDVFSLYGRAKMNTRYL